MSGVNGRETQKPQGFTAQKRKKKKQPTPEKGARKKEELKNKNTAENGKQKAEGTEIKMTTTRTIEARIAEATRTAMSNTTNTTNTFGIELELTGISRKRVSELVYNYLQSQEEIEIYCSETYKIIDQQGRKWSVDYDGSIHGDFLEQVELVTPILTMKDLPLLKGLIETLKAAGAKSSDKLGCGLHLHIGGQGHTARSIRNLVNIMAAHEDQLFKAFSVTMRDRVGHYCKKVDDKFLKALNEQKPATLDKLADLWYQTQGYDFMRNDKYKAAATTH